MATIFAAARQFIKEILPEKLTGKLILDGIIALFLLLLLDDDNTGLLLHEVLGLILSALFAFHVILNWKMAWALLKKVFSQVLKPHSRVMILLDILLGVLTLVAAATGVLISEELFHLAQGGWLQEVLQELHELSGKGLFLVMALHAALHVKLFASWFRTGLEWISKK